MRTGPTILKQIVGWYCGACGPIAWGGKDKVGRWDRTADTEAGLAFPNRIVVSNRMGTRGGTFSLLRGSAPRFIACSRDEASAQLHGARWVLKNHLALRKNSSGKQAAISVRSADAGSGWKTITVKGRLQIHFALRKRGWDGGRLWHQETRAEGNSSPTGPFTR